MRIFTSLLAKHPRLPATLHDSNWGIVLGKVFPNDMTMSRPPDMDLKLKKPLLPALLSVSRAI